MKQVDFENTPIGRSLVSTALPMLAAQILNLLYSIVDRIYIGRIPGTGSAALGGVGLAFPFIIIITAFTNLYGSGGAPLCSMARGRGDRSRAAQIMNIAFFLLTVTSVFLTLAGEVLAVPALRLFGASDENLVFALPYLRIYLIGTFFSMTATGLNPYINAQGFSETGMFTVVIGAVSNIILDPVFIFVLGMGVQGAALATILSQSFSAFFVIRFLRGNRAELQLSFIRPSGMSRHLQTVRDIIGLGAAAFVMQFTNALVQICCNSMLSSVGGDLYVSVMTILSSVRQMLETPILAITEGCSPIISYNYGAERPKRIFSAIRIMTLCAFIYTLVVWGLILLFPKFFIGVFSSDKALLTAAIPSLHLYFFAFAFQTLQYSGQTVFKSLNKKKHAIFFSLLRKAVMVVPLTLLLPRIGSLGVRGVFMAEPISNVIGGTACFSTMLATVLPELKTMEKKHQ